MKNITDFNTKQVHFNFEIPEGQAFDYYNLKELYEENGKEKIYMVRALYVNEYGYYGESPLIVEDNKYINLPNHLTEQVKEIRGDERIVGQINDGLIGFSIYEYTQKKHNRKCYSINWVLFKEPQDIKKIGVQDYPFF